MTTAVSVQSVNPTLENFFGLILENEYESTEGSNENQGWTNPYLERNNAFTPPTLAAITPYIPGDNQQFSVTAPSEFWNHDVAAIILSKLDLKNLIKSSSVCKSFYLASKANFIWEVQLCNLLPKVKVRDQNLCIFTPEQQYKVIFKRIENECKPYHAKFTRNQELYQNQQNKLKTLELEFEEAGGKDAASRFDQELANLFQQDNGELINDFIQNSPDSLASRLKTKIMQLQRRLVFFFGENYNGEIDSIAPDSVQGEILNAIHVLVPNAFNNQEKFDLVIDKSVAAKNTSSSKTDVAEPG